jgi:ATP phosphoribosyltransferase
LYPAEDGWVAVEVMIEKKEIADKMDELGKVGAQDIVVFALLNTRTAPPADEKNGQKEE